MARTLIGAAVGLFTGLLAMAVWDASYGYREGISSRPDLAPGWETAGIMALFCSVMFG